MWQLINIAARNICAFEELNYSLVQNQATLIFGNNLDCDSQNSNGSGKSALIEVIAIGLTGETLRKVNIDEIINDRFDEAMVSIQLHNTILGHSITINRRLSRKNPQEIQVLLQHGPYDTDTEEIKQATVADYNKYILEQIGLSKDDIFSNFILTARKYKSFLACSDKEKKEIINRFSNGIIVDESLDALHTDMEPIQEELQKAERQVSEYNGRVSALAGEIERAINESADVIEKRKARIVEWQEVISQKRQEIRKYRQEIENIDNELDAIDKIDEKIQNLEKQDIGFTEAYNQIKEWFETLGVSTFTDYSLRIQEDQCALEKEKGHIANITDRVTESCKTTKRLSLELESMRADHDKTLSQLEKKSWEIDASIKELADTVRSLRDKSQQLTERKKSLIRVVSDLEKRLAGVIRCPKCRHEFVIADDIDVEATKQELQLQKGCLDSTEDELENANQRYDECVEKGRKERQRQTEVLSQRQQLEDSYRQQAQQVNDAESNLRRLESQLEDSKAKLNRLETTIANMREDMFDEAFDIIDHIIKRSERRIAEAESTIGSLKGAIGAYEQQITELNNAKDDDILGRLKESKSKYEDELQVAVAYREQVEARLNELKIQEATFLEFKTYLANTKINAIAQITNDFLEAIGSDIRISLSGYTVLKSGKVRDKISISLIRDGVDCGSFDKFSAGEKCRVELASVLALHKLSNVNCDDGKGLNLLVIDEILDCTDEAGLANVFKALNDTQVTALVVSHGNIAENYAHRLIVTKQNGVSSIDGKPD